MDDVVQQFLGYIREVLRRQALVSSVAIALCLTGWVMVYRLPDLYRAETIVYIDARSFLDELLVGLAVEERGGDRELVELARASITNRESLERIVREADLGLASMTPAQHDGLLATINSQINVQTTGGRSANQLEIEFLHPDPEVAQIAVVTLLNTLIETSLGSQQADTRSSEEFVEKQIVDYEGRLTEAEQKLSAFKREHIGLLPGEGQSYFSQLQEARNNVENTKLELEDAVNRKKRLEAQLAALQDPRAQGGVALSSSRVRGLQDKLDDLLLRYTENHPEVVSTREQLARLTDPNRVVTMDELSDDSSGAVGKNIVTAEFMVELSRLDAEVDSISSRLREYERRRRTLEEAITTMPEIEAQLVKLTRNYDIYRTQYEELVERRESARLSREAGVNRDDSRFRIIEPPHTTVKPVSPDRFLFNTIVLIGAWGVAFGIAVVLAELGPTLSTIGEVTKFTNLPVIGTISMATEQQLFALDKFKILGFGVAISSGLYAVVLSLSVGMITLPGV